MSKLKRLRGMKERRNEERHCKRLGREGAKVARERIRKEYILQEKYDKEMRKEERERRRYKELYFANYMKRIENSKSAPIISSESNIQLQPFDFVCVSPITEEDEEQVTEDPLSISNNVLHSPRGKSEPYNAIDDESLTYNSYSYHKVPKEEAENKKPLFVMHTASSTYDSVSSEKADLAESEPHFVTCNVPTVSVPSSYSCLKAIDDHVESSGMLVICNVSSSCDTRASHPIGDGHEESSEPHLPTYTAQSSDNSCPPHEFINENGESKVLLVSSDVSSATDMAPSHKAIDWREKSGEPQSDTYEVPTTSGLWSASHKDIDRQEENNAPHSSVCSALEEEYSYASCKQTDEQVAINESVDVTHNAPAFNKRNVTKKRERKAKHNVLQWDKYGDCVEEVSFFSYCWSKNGNRSICDEYNKLRSVRVKQEKCSETSESNLLDLSLEDGTKLCQPLKIESDMSFIQSDFMANSETDESELFEEKPCIIRQGVEISDQSSKKSLSLTDIHNKTNLVKHGRVFCQPQSDCETDESRLFKEKPCVTSLGLEISNQSLKKSLSLTGIVHKTLSVNQTQPIEFENEISSLEPIVSEKSTTETSVTKLTEDLLHSDKESAVTCTDSSSSKKQRKRKSPHRPLEWDSPKYYVWRS